MAAVTRRVALFGGTFDPPHLGHVSAAKTALLTLEPDKLLWLPALGAPHKTHAASVAPEHRLAMSRLAAESLSERVIVSDYEMRPGVSAYTADTMEWLRAQEPDAELWLVVGQDMLLTLDQWYRADKLLAMCHVATLGRAGGQDASIAAVAESLQARFSTQVRPLEHTPLEVSSTQLRDALKQGKGHELLPAPVWHYIREWGLYSTDGEC